ncbi:MAG: hypothetical protein WBA98_08240 [Gordonia sp. (in: high G+C Gram-positive bacteria)]|uniref:hypothetical protein n=1 Tax=Gordonia sp. (in: high G+C Gram-positive bacteria) TaxID=84139 RepID=UPI003C792773
MTTTDLKPGEAWLIRVGDVEIPAIRCGSKRFPWSFVDEETGDRNAVDGTPLRRLVPEPTAWETLRAAALIMSDIAGVNPSRTESHLRDTAFRLEAEHAAAQAEAAADAARDALIEKAAQTIAYAIEPNDDDVSADYLWKRYLAHGSQERYRANARALADAGLLVDPEAEATA